MGFSCDTFYRYQGAMEAGGVEVLIDANRRKPTTARIASKRRRKQSTAQHSFCSGAVGFWPGSCF
ncbi:MAG: hypothetical protein V9E86_05675 [Nitrosomonas sp.]